MKKITYPSSILASFLLMATTANAAEEAKEVQDMSDPLAVYTQVGAGYTDKGLNFKLGVSYDSGKPATMAMNVLEVKGVWGETLGTRDYANDDIDSIRFRNFIVDGTDGRGSQVDVSYNFNSMTGAASYSLIQALPKMGPVMLYPLGGVGVAIANDVNNNPLWSDSDSPSGFSVPGAFAMLGFYGKLDLTENIWFNYNPVWLKAFAGSDAYKDNAYGVGEQDVFTHEMALSYQITPIMNVRYFANWTTELSFDDGDHRIELNYQL